MKGHYSDVWQAIGAAFPDRPAVISRERTLTYGELVREAGGLAATFTGMGLRPGDAVAILSYNRPEYIVALLACLSIGVAPVPINFRYRAGEVEALLRDSDARAVIFPASLGELAVAATNDLETPPHFISITDGTTHQIGAIPYADAIAPEVALPATPPPGGELRIYTGGTTGQPKAVVWGAEDILSVQLYSIYAPSGLPLPEDLDDVVRIAADPATPRVATLPLAPFMHGTALFTSMNTMVLGGTIIVQASASFDPADAADLALTEGATRLVVAGDAVALPLVEEAERTRERTPGAPTIFDAASSVISSGMRFSAETKRRMHELGDVTIIDLLASTEGGPYAVNTTTSAAEVPGRLRLLPGAVVLDEDFHEVQDQPGGRGILAFRGTLPRGYWRDEAKTAESFPIVGGVRHVMPGDWAIADGSGFVELLGRGSAVVNTGGEKVYPAEVEEALLAYPAVRDAVVFGTPDSRLGETVSAVVAPAEGRSIDVEELREFVGPRLAGYKKPRILLVRATLERTPHGKVDLNRMREWVTQAQEEAPAAPGIPHTSKENTQRGGLTE